MALYKYIKKYPKQKSKLIHYLSFVSISIGAFLLFWGIWPIMSFNIFTINLFSKTVSPIQEETASTFNQANITVLAASKDNQEENINTPDYTNPNIWFPKKPQEKLSSKAINYDLSLPALKIFDAKVIIGGDDLNKGLIHYGGTAIPGEYGNTVVFGHSTLPQFFNPEDYHSIFSLLPTLRSESEDEKGDMIYITYDGITYKYEIIDMHVTDPEDLSPLEQHFDDSYITLITCVPPGTYWKRLNVKAKLIPL